LGLLGKINQEMGMVIHIPQNLLIGDVLNVTLMSSGVVTVFLEI